MEHISAESRTSSKNSTFSKNTGPTKFFLPLLQSSPEVRGVMLCKGRSHSAETLQPLHPHPCARQQSTEADSPVQASTSEKLSFSTMLEGTHDCDDMTISSIDIGESMDFRHKCHRDAFVVEHELRESCEFAEEDPAVLTELPKFPSKFASKRPRPPAYIKLKRIPAKWLSAPPCVPRCFKPVVASTSGVVPVAPPMDARKAPPAPRRMRNEGYNSGVGDLHGSVDLRDGYNSGVHD